MALVDDLRNYIATHGRDSTSLVGNANVVIVGETHAFLTNNDSAIRATASVRLVRELLRDLKYRYFANESFLNAGPVRLGVREYWRRGTLPPVYDPAAQRLEIEEIGKRVLTRRFQAVLDDLRANPRYVLSIGSRIDGPGRDRRLAQHFFEELRDRNIPLRVPGLLLLGIMHAAATPFAGKRPATTRMVLERNGHKCVSILILTDFSRGGQNDDAVFDLDGKAPEMRLTALAAKKLVSVDLTQAMPGGQGNPFSRIGLLGSDTGRSVAEQFEHIVLQKA